jgi:hypothetical protein
MKIKTNIRAGAGSNSSGVDTSTSSGVNAGGVNGGSKKPVPAPVYYSRCVGI